MLQHCAPEPTPCDSTTNNDEACVWGMPELVLSGHSIFKDRDEAVGKLPVETMGVRRSVPGGGKPAYAEKQNSKWTQEHASPGTS